jgi:hypothetical protein
VAALVRLRFLEAMSGRLLLLVPLHFVMALAAVATLPDGPEADRLAAGHSTAVGLAAVLGIIAAALLGGTALPVERERARGAMVLVGAPGPAMRALAAVTGGLFALALLSVALLASALAAVDLGIGSAGPAPRAAEHPLELTGGLPDPGHDGLVWLNVEQPAVKLAFASDTDRDDVVLEVEAAPRVGRDGALPAVKEVAWIAAGAEGATTGRAVARSLYVPFRIFLPKGVREVSLRRVDGNFDLGLRRTTIRRDAGTRSRALARGLHGAALLAGLAAILATAVALSTLTGAGVASAGAMGLAALALSRSLFVDAARILGGAHALEEALDASQGHEGHLHAPAQGTPTAAAPLFEFLADVVPDGTRWDLSGALTANRVPDPESVTAAIVAGVLWTAGWTAVAAVAAGRRS